MSELQQALIKLENAINELEEMEQASLQSDGQTDLFGNKHEDSEISNHAGHDNVHVLERKEIETRLNNVIGKVENLLAENN